jgi:hypothetical protein
MPVVLARIDGPTDGGLECCRVANVAGSLNICSWLDIVADAESASKTRRDVIHCSVCPLKMGSLSRTAPDIGSIGGTRQVRLVVLASSDRHLMAAWTAAEVLRLPGSCGLSSFSSDISRPGGEDLVLLEEMNDVVPPGSGLVLPDLVARSW